MELLVNRNPDAFVLIVVPTEIIKNQWVEQLIERNLFLNCKVEIINTVVKNTYNVDLLILDEVHAYMTVTYAKVFDVVEYKLILSLTATLERLDGKEELIKENLQFVMKFLLKKPYKTDDYRHLKNIVYY